MSGRSGVRVQRSGWRKRSKRPDKRLEIASIQELHDVVEGPLFRQPEIEHADCMRRGKRCSRTGLAFESPHGSGRLVRAPVAKHIGSYELDCGARRQQTVSGEPYFSHPARAEAFDQLIAA